MTSGAAGRVTGYGGVFFRAADPDALVKWYARMLGVPSFDFWAQAAGPAVFAPFQRQSDYWPAEKQWMLNLRVEGLDALIQSLRENGVEVETRPDEWDDPATGRFARIVDPEGNNVELWEPPDA